MIVYTLQMVHIQHHNNTTHRYTTHIVVRLNVTCMMLKLLQEKQLANYENKRVHRVLVGAR